MKNNEEKITEYKEYINGTEFIHKYDKDGNLIYYKIDNEEYKFDKNVQ